MIAKLDNSFALNTVDWQELVRARNKNLFRSKAVGKIASQKVDMDLLKQRERKRNEWWA